MYTFFAHGLECTSFYEDEPLAHNCTGFAKPSLWVLKDTLLSIFDG